MKVDKKLEEICEGVLEESKKKFTQLDAMKSVRKPMPPASKVHKGVKDYKRTENKKAIKSGLNEQQIIKEALTPQAIEVIQKWIGTLGTRAAAKKIINNYIKQVIGLSSDDLADTATFANGLDAVEEALTQGDFQGAANIARETAQEMLEEEGME